MTAIQIDEVSLLVDVPADASLGAVEDALAARGLTLDVEALDAKRGTLVGDWLAAGAPGARDSFRDPADQLLAGMGATLPDGRALEIRPAPRRAVGPDLTALFVGAGERFGRITRAVLRVHPRGVPRPESAAFVRPVAPPLEPGEERLLHKIAEEIRRR